MRRSIARTCLGTLGLLLLIGPLAGCAKQADVRTYDNSLFEIAAAVTAKDLCSCVFVAGRDEAFCDEWTRKSPNIASHHVDYEAMTVRSRALGMAKTVARYEGELTGCVIVSGD